MNSPVSLPARAWRALRREWTLRRGGILSATFGMTYKCNLRCTTCGVWVRGETDTEVELTTGELVDAARQLGELRVPQAVLVGSEPLLRRDALEVIEALRRNGLEVDVITNGTLFTEALCDRIVEAGVRSIIVSIDAVGERHNVIRGQAKAWERAMAGMTRLAGVRNRKQAPAPRLAMHATISNLNTDVLEELSDLQDSSGLDVSFQLVSQTTMEEVDGTRLEGQVVAGQEFISRDGSWLPDEEGVRRIRRFLARPGILKKHPTLAILAAMSDDDIRRGRFPVRTCRVVEAEILIDPYGDVRPCGHLENYSYGNIRHESLRQIWNGERRRRMTDAVRRDMFPVCDKCCQHAQNLTFWQKGRMMLRSLGG